VDEVPELIVDGLVLLGAELPKWRRQTRALVPSDKGLPPSATTDEPVRGLSARIKLHQVKHVRCWLLRTALPL
jgi:hypothetical protein